MKKLEKNINKMLNAFELKTRENGEKFYVCNDDTFQDIIYNAHLDRMPCDSIYDTIHTILCAMSDAQTSDVDELTDVIYHIEADYCTSDLTAWLHSDNRNVYYLTEALEEYGVTDGFQALSLAQYKFIQEVGNELLTGLCEL